MDDVRRKLFGSRRGKLETVKLCQIGDCEIETNWRLSNCVKIETVKLCEIGDCQIVSN